MGLLLAVSGELIKKLHIAQQQRDLSPTRVAMFHQQR
jgi:hypothetical protein